MSSKKARVNLDCGDFCSEVVVFGRALEGFRVGRFMIFRTAFSALFRLVRIRSWGGFRMDFVQAFLGFEEELANMRAWEEYLDFYRQKEL